MQRRSLANRIGYAAVRWFCRVVFVATYRIRCEGRQYVPASGAAMLLSNHQSYLDPVAAAVACDRPLSAIARETLFRSGLVGWLIDFLGAFPLDQEGSGLSGIKETLKRLRQGELVLVYPEGVRTFDGRLLPLKSGFATIARRARVPLVPLAVDGAFQAWPRWRRLPGGGVIQVQFGPPIQPDDLDRMSDEELTAEAARRMCDCLAEARRRRNVRCSRWRRMADRAVYGAGARRQREGTASTDSDSPIECSEAV